MGYARVWDRPVVVLCAGLRAHIGHREKKKIIARSCHHARREGRASRVKTVMEKVRVAVACGWVGGR